ncbi:putative prophage protein [Escherichia coli]|uniref:Putative prophage protein n=4 Tax=Escherichia coli TaxID=562 RepID=A0A376J5V3_ECOLX|nr:putative prophage protein [Escherichia coli]
MTEAEILRLIRRVAGISQQADEQTTQPDSVTAENYVRVVAEVIRRNGIQLNDVDMRNIRIRVLEMLAYNRRRGTVSGNGENYVPLEEAGAVCGGNWLIFSKFASGEHRGKPA